MGSVTMTSNAHVEHFEKFTPEPFTEEDASVEFPDTLPISASNSRLPFVLAACVFLMQACTCAVCLCWLPSARPTRERKQFRYNMVAHVLTTFPELITYGILAWSSDARMWTVTLAGPYLLGRSWCWLLSNTLHWYCFANSCTAAKKDARNKLMLHTFLMEIFGLLSLYTTSHAWAGICFLVSATFFVLMYLEESRIPWREDMDVLSGAMVTFDLMLWAAYPIILGLRFFGCMSFWWEQVFAYTVIDVCAKSLSFSGIIVKLFVADLQDIEQKSRELEMLSKSGPSGVQQTLATIR